MSEIFSFQVEYNGTAEREIPKASSGLFFLAIINNRADLPTNYHTFYFYLDFLSIIKPNDFVRKNNCTCHEFVHSFFFRKNNVFFNFTVLLARVGNAREMIGGPSGFYNNTLRNPLTAERAQRLVFSFFPILSFCFDLFSP